MLNIQTQTTLLFEKTGEVYLFDELQVKNRDQYWQQALDTYLLKGEFPDGVFVHVKTVPANHEIIPVSRSLVLANEQSPDQEIVFNGVGAFQFGEDGQTVYRQPVSENMMYADVQNRILQEHSVSSGKGQWGTMIVTQDGSIEHLNDPEPLGAFTVPNLQHKITANELVEEIVANNDIKVEVPHFVAAREFGADHMRVAGGVYIRPQIITYDKFSGKDRVAHDTATYLRFVQYRAIRELLDYHLVHPQLHFGNRGWCMKNPKVIQAYIGDWEDLMYTLDYDNEICIPLEMLGAEKVQVTALEKARIVSIRKAISSDINTPLVDVANIKDWRDYIENEVLLPIISGMLKTSHSADAMERFKKRMKIYEKELGVEYKKLINQFAGSLKFILTNVSEREKREAKLSQELHLLVETELAVFVALVLVKEISEEKPTKKRKRR